MIALIVLAATLFVAAVVVFLSNKGQPKPDRAERLSSVTTVLGLAPVDADSVPPLGSFALVGDAAMIFNVTYGVVEARATWLFDADRAVDGSARSLSCALARMPGTRPNTTLVGQAMTQVLGRPPRIAVVTPADPTLAAGVDVRSDDAAFAAALLAGPLSEFLTRFGADFAFEVSGEYLLCVTSRLAPERIALVVKALCAFLDAVPADVWEHGRAA